MIAVIFEMFPKKGKWKEYLDIAAELRPELSKIKGFISIERFQSISNPDKFCHYPFGKMKAALHNGEIWNFTGKHK